MEDIFKIKQGDSELLREFMDRFQRERMTLPRIPDNCVAMAFSSSSVNIILLRVVNEMQAEDKMISKAHTLSDFDKSSVVTKREIILTTFAEGVVKDTKFQVVEMDMAYKMILGRPRIHEMDVVPSTLHQVIKFPLQWGIRQIRGDQQTSRRINSVADSSAKNEEK
ncbi:uncharacterized protein LOC142163334 [Nicotiana tabacum]|uniref:Uncharacterized protein LOC142163334 n=1 Tax=Nicotiana tabacum TaxID=4097 RepID=A0AC58RVG7_TOBAC